MIRSRRAFLAVVALPPIALFATGCVSDLMQREFAKVHKVSIADASLPAPNNARQRDFLHLVAMVNASFSRSPISDDYPTPQLTALRNETFARLAAPVNDVEFRLLLNRYLAALHNGHSHVDGAPVYSRKRTFPVRLDESEGKLFILHVETGMDRTLMGGELLSINGISAAEVLGRITPYVPADNEFWASRTAVQEYLASPEVLRLIGVVGEKDSVLLSIRKKDSSVVALALGTMADDDLWFAPLPPRRELRHFAKPFYWQLLPDANAAYLRMATFQDARVMREGMSQFVRWYLRPLGKIYVNKLIRKEDISDFGALIDTLFNAMDERGTEHLIVDIRDNRGGQPDLTDPLFARLGVLDSLRGFDRYHRMSELYRSFGNTGYAQFNKEYKRRFGQPLPDTGLVRGLPDLRDSVVARGVAADRKEQGRSRPLRLYVITSAGTFSAAANFATIVQDNRIGVIVGGPTGGRPTGATGLAAFRLPESGVTVAIAPSFQIRPDTIRNGENAVIPDYYVRDDIAARTDGKDAVLAWLLDGIKSGSVVAPALGKKDLPKSH